MFESRIIVIRGPIGAGKTSLMESLRNRVPNSSMIEIDVLKRMIEPGESTEWRRDISLKAAAFLASQLLCVQRTVITEVHSSRPDQLKTFQEVADNHAVALKSYLLMAPLQVCIARAAAREVPGISYKIDEDMVTRYYQGTYRIESEPQFDTSELSTAEVTSKILHELGVTEHATPY